jgi:hypothetical protein
MREIALVLCRSMSVGNALFSCINTWVKFLEIGLNYYKIEIYFFFYCNIKSTDQHISYVKIYSA